MSPPPIFNVSLAVNCLLLIAAMYFLLSLTAHFRRITAKPKTNQTQAEALAKWMSRGAFGAVITSFPFYILFIVHFASTTLDNTGCLVTENLPVMFYAAHKLCAYLFIYFRVKTFEDFFTERGWRRLRIFGIFAGLVYFGIICFIVPYVSFAGLEAFDPSAGYCKKKLRQAVTNPIFFVFGGIIILTDLSIAVVGTGSFIRILFCSDTLGQITRKDPQIAEAGRNVAVWSALALTSTAIFMGLTVATDLAVFGGVDVAVNSFCICKQYPDCLTSLLWLIFGYKNVEAIRMKSGDGDELRDEGAVTGGKSDTLA